MPALDVDFHDERISMLHWYPRIKDLPVPVPQTEFFNLDGSTSTMELREGGLDMEQVIESLENIPAEEIAETVASFPTEKAHIRSDWKASRLAGGEGRAITNDPRIIHEEVLQLIDSMVMTGFPHNSLVVREWITVDELARSYNKSICPEVRVIVDEGEVLGSFLDVYEDEFDMSFTTEEITACMNKLTERFENNRTKLEDWASVIARELDETGWSIDFIQDTNGDWHITDMALYGLYWSEDKQKWHNISHVPTEKPYNLEENTPEALPETK